MTICSLGNATSEPCRTFMAASIIFSNFAVELDVAAGGDAVRAAAVVGSASFAPVSGWAVAGFFSFAFGLVAFFAPAAGDGSPPAAANGNLK